jgi:RNA polymerase sigma factor (sigma-70 family)
VSSPFHSRFVELFDAHYPKLYRYLNRLSGEPDLAADIAQEAFVKLYRRGSMPDSAEAWLVTVAMNLLRNEKSTRNRRLRLLSSPRAEMTLSDPPPSPEERVESNDSRRKVRAALGRITERERRLLLLRAEGYSYRDIASALDLNEGSVGALLARARQAFRAHYKEEPPGAS